MKVRGIGLLSQNSVLSVLPSCFAVLFNQPVVADWVILVSVADAPDLDVIVSLAVVL